MIRVLRGGSWNNNQDNARAAYRDNNHPTNRNNNIGFRLARFAMFIRPSSGHCAAMTARSRQAGKRCSGNARCATQRCATLRAEAKEEEQPQTGLVWRKLRQDKGIAGAGRIHHSGVSPGAVCARETPPCLPE